MASETNNKDQEENLLKYKVLEIPDTILYIPNFISEQEEKDLLDHVYSAPKPKWTHLSNRRLQNWGGLPHPKGMVAENIPQWLKIYTERIAKLGIFAGQTPNHILVNEYLTGQGIMPHEDGPLFYPTVTTISLGSSTVLDFYHHLNQCVQTSSETTSSSLENRHLTSIFLEPRSLIVVKDAMYESYLHGIDQRQEDEITDKIANLSHCQDVTTGDIRSRTTRVSLTIRIVPKVLKNKLFFGKKA
ncbi:hypothetical protein SNE40_009181 [Patella caerulea]|uniref:Fe2OG dioxygenase domain-containing protein n=1 Tax=Patella caerulea TaxID=87958 RepID=A0AAN8JXW1_PATCE